MTHTVYRNTEWVMQYKKIGDRYTVLLTGQEARGISFYSQEIFACLSKQPWWVQKWVWFEQKVGVVKNFRSRLYIYGPLNLPTPEKLDWRA